MKQIQNTVPQSQHHARACRPPAAQIRRLVHRSGAKSRRASKATRRDEASAEVGRARTTKKREGACVEAEQESNPYLRVVVFVLPRGGCAPCLPPCSCSQPARPGGNEGSSPRRRQQLRAGMAAQRGSSHRSQQRQRSSVAAVRAEQKSKEEIRPVRAE